MKDSSELEPRLLRSFVAVAEELHFGRAARRLHLSQPPLSMQIKKLEETLGAKLFERDRRHVALTEAGTFLLERARHLLAEAARACREIRRISEGDSGALAIGYTTTATYEVLPPLIARYRAARPEVALELIEMKSALMPDALRSNRIELGFACGPLEPGDLVERVVVRERMLVAVSRENALAARARLKLRDLEGQPFVLVRPDVEPAWAGACAAALRSQGLDYVVAQETDSKLAMLGLVAANVGVSLVSESMQRLRRAGVKFLPLADFALRLPLVTLARPDPSPRAREFLKLARQRAG